MTDKTDDGGPAFPVIERQEHSDGEIVCAQRPGISKREWFAGMALQGMCSNSDISKAMSEAGLKPIDVRKSFARSAVNQADEILAMLSEGKKK